MRYGDQTEQVWITGSFARLSQYFTDPMRIIQALEQRNVIAETGRAETARSKIPMRTTGPFTTEDQIANVMVDVSRTGEPVYIKDFAKVERRYQDPVFLVRYDESLWVAVGRSRRIKSPEWESPDETYSAFGLSAASE